MNTVSNYSIEVWQDQVKQKIKSTIASADWADCYEVDAAHVFELEDGSYLFVRESGCSCYSYDDAVLTFFKTKEAAMNEYNKVAK